MASKLTVLSKVSRRVTDCRSSRLLLVASCAALTKSAKSVKIDASAEGAFAHFRRFLTKTALPSVF